jgi:hypothetical protein
MCCSCNRFGARVCATAVESGQLPAASSVLAIIRDAIIGDGKLGVVRGEVIGAYLPRTIVQRAMDYACSLEADCDSTQPWVVLPTGYGMPVDTLLPSTTTGVWMPTPTPTSPFVVHCIANEVDIATFAHKKDIYLDTYKSKTSMLLHMFYREL